MQRCKRERCRAFVPAMRLAHGAVYCSAYCQRRASRETKEGRKRNRDHVLAWQAAHPEETKARKATWAARNPRKAKGAQLKYRYGITMDDYEQLLEEQQYRCAICGAAHEEAPRKRLQVEHHHGSTRVRGLVCMGCNTGLSFVERPGWLEAALGFIAGYD